MPKLLAFHNNTGSRAWRLVPQVYYLHEKYGWDVEVRQGSMKASLEEIKRLIDTTDILFYQSVFDRSLVEYAKSKGKRVVFEFDDLLHIVPEDHPEFERVSKPDFQAGVEYIIRNADKLITTNEFLKDQYKDWNANINVFPNYMDLNFWEVPQPSKLHSDKIRLGWAGGVSHVGDLRFISPILRRLCDKYPKLKIVYCGGGGAPGDDAWKAYNYGKDLLPEVPLKQREYSLGTPLEAWPAKSASLQFDIGIAPLVDHKFNHCKSAIKWMEYGINRVPSVCQKFLYEQVIEDGVNGFTATEPDEWFEKLSRLIEDADLRKRIGEQAYLDVKAKHNLNDHLKEWVDIVTK